ncbi:hypothetical protein BC936DRAFT_142950 [Jimgerdemannia flammicorona]|uniref:Uncharacterized protein n=1 Tax=Jimgerdemannia flammicorona TaxID=994334 RepID=A0A432ZZN2_9FUNG|nr:hypothetical protein BC936DRAFT_142950 [Jimgerdemannia flammicorona]
MDVFLSTLPPYVHCHLANHPPTDVFNVLRDLICFAVIYSNSITSVRDAIQNFDKTSPELLNTAPVVAEQKASARPDAVLAHNKNTNTKTKTVTKENLKPKRDIPNIYPSWWGDQDQDDPELWRGGWEPATTTCAQASLCS